MYVWQWMRCVTSAEFHINNSSIHKMSTKIIICGGWKPQHVFLRFANIRLKIFLPVRYQNETNEDDIKSGKRIVEMEKERPAFFSANLMQKARTSSESAKSTTVRPTGLG